MRPAVPNRASARTRAAAARIAEAPIAGRPARLDLGLTQGRRAATLFAEAAQAYAPLLFPQPLRRGRVHRALGTPGERGRAVVARLPRGGARLASPPHAMPPAPRPAADNPFRRCNRRLLDPHLACGGERVWLLCPWDGRAATAPGAPRIWSRR